MICDFVCRRLSTRVPLKCGIMVILKNRKYFHKILKRCNKCEIKYELLDEWKNEKEICSRRLCKKKSDENHNYSNVCGLSILLFEYMVKLSS